MSIQDKALLPQGYYFRPIEVAIGLPADWCITHSETGRPLNDANFLLDADPIGTIDYAYDTLGQVERRFMRAFARANGIIELMPLWLRQLGVYHRWISMNRWLPIGERMRELYAATVVAPGDIERKKLHSDAVKRHAEEAADGRERQRLWNEARAREAEERRAKEAEAKAQKEARKAQLRAAKALAAAEVELTLSEYQPGLVPLVVWVSQGVKDGLLKHIQGGE